MSHPKCECTIKYDFHDSVFPARIVYCSMHSAAGELFELVEMQIALRDAAIAPGHEFRSGHPYECRCWACRAYRVVLEVVTPKIKEAPHAKEEKGPEKSKVQTKTKAVKEKQ